MATIVKRKLSGSTDGKPILVAGTASTGGTIHTSVAGTVAGTYDEIWLWAYNGGTVNVTLTTEFGGTTAPDQNIVCTLASKSGLIPIVPGLILQNGAVVTAFASVGSAVTLLGFVNSMTD